MDWEAIGVGVAAAAALSALNAFVVKLVVQSAVDRALLNVSQQYLTKLDLERHEHGCPARCKEFGTKT